MTCRVVLVYSVDGAFASQTLIDLGGIPFDTRGAIVVDFRSALFDYVLVSCTTPRVILYTVLTRHARQDPAPITRSCISAAVA